MKRDILKYANIKIPSGAIPINLWKKPSDEVYGVSVDGVDWFVTGSMMHAVVLYTMMSEHLTDYMNYRKVD